jgi:type IV pilus assembly protein PilQ
MPFGGGIGASNLPIGAQPEQLNVNLPVAGAAGQLALSILNLGSGNLVNIELSALEADNRGKVVSSPRVITADKKRAVISQGTEIPYLTAAASGATTVSFKPATLELSVTPRITPDDRIIMDLEGEEGFRGRPDPERHAGGTIPRSTRRRSRPRCSSTTATRSCWAVSSSRPRARRWTRFRSSATCRWWATCSSARCRQDDKTELLIFVTPKIVKDTLTVR